MSAVEKLTIALTPEMAGFVRSAVHSGQYASASEAIRDAVREWQERRDLLGYSIEDLREAVREGIEGGFEREEPIAAIKAEARREFESRTLGKSQA